MNENENEGRRERREKRKRERMADRRSEWGDRISRMDDHAFHCAQNIYYDLYTQRTYSTLFVFRITGIRDYHSERWTLFYDFAIAVREDKRN